MPRSAYSTYNLYFLIPFSLWMVSGGILLCFFNKQVLFTTVNMHHTPFLDVLMYHITHMGEALFIIPALLIAMGAFIKQAKWYFITATACNGIPSLLIQYIKHKVEAPRPLQYFHEANWIHIIPEWPRLYHDSFPSGHSTGAFSLYCFLSYLLPSRYRAFGLLFFLLALSVCYSRMYVAAHFFADVYVGSMIGCLVGTACFSLMHYFQPGFYPDKKATA
ncbi:phosphatase PAP2 family protein [Chitinophagaceae bacterium MMS25-I14]